MGRALIHIPIERLRQLIELPDDVSFVAGIKLDPLRQTLVCIVEHDDYVNVEGAEPPSLLPIYDSQLYVAFNSLPEDMQVLMMEAGGAGMLPRYRFDDTTLRAGPESATPINRDGKV